MRCLYACRGFSSTATVIAAALFSMTASATTLTPLPPTYDYAARTITIGVSVADIPPPIPATPRVAFFLIPCHPGFCSPTMPAVGPEVAYVQNGVALLTTGLLPPGAYPITAIFTNPDGSGVNLSFTIQVPAGANVIVPTVLSLLSD